MISEYHKRCFEDILRENEDLRNYVKFYQKENIFLLKNNKKLERQVEKLSKELANIDGIMRR